MNTTDSEKPLCPNGCGARIGPRGRGSHNKNCPNRPGLPQVANDENAAIVARLRTKRTELWSAVGAAIQNAHDALPEKSPNEAQEMPVTVYTNVHQHVQEAHTALALYEELVEMLDGKG